MMIRKYIIALIVLFSSTTLAADEVSFGSLMDSIEDVVTERSTEAVIRSIDLGERTGVMGGFNYFFGPSTDAYPLKVKMLGKDFGSLEMLKVGDSVQILYIQVGQHRIANEIKQIELVEEF